ncbi:related to translation initiation factor eIF-4F [Rhynchosporium agropyri]|uniref:Related to translation initiation factor eIF-4F n=1 Tax=Rhynchosporium agropyri TaxID=914238 RepID=A0A1E1KWR7_9HELO|nr:related to translation initiation factor eIF-4F [Rhynchosporium agropyri]
MTSVSQQSQLPNQASNSTSASQPTLSYASTAKKAVSSPPNATSSSTPSPAVAVGGSGPVQHGKSSSISPMNGKPAISPAVPAVSAPAIAHSSSATNGSSADHSRKTSVQIGVNGMNGGPVGGMKIQFGNLPEASPKVAHGAPEGIHNAASAPIPIANPRVIDPSHSPSPIPAPSVSGGKPTSGLGQASNAPMLFGSFDNQRHGQRTPSNQGALAPASQQTGHARQESAQSTQSDMSNHTGGNSGRGGYAGRGGRGGGNNFNPSFQQPQQMGYPPPNTFRPSGNQPRGAMAAPFQSQGRPQYPNSPHQVARSPNLANSIPGGSMPGTPNMNQAMPMQNQPYNNYYQQQMHPQVNHPSAFNHSTDVSSNSYPTRSKKSRQWSTKSNENPWSNKSNDQFSNRPRLRETSREVARSVYTAEEPMPPVREVQAPYDASRNPRSGSMSISHGIPHEPHAPSSRTYQNGSHNLPTLPPFVPQNPKIAKVPAIDLSPENNNFETYLHMVKQYPGYQPSYDARGMPMGGMPFNYPQMAHMGYNGAPSSPQPHFQQPTQYTPGQYNGGGQSMSRNGSQISERPASSMGQPGTPSMTPISHAQHTPQPKPNIPASPAFTRPVRKSAAILIKRPDGEALDIGSFKAPASPAPSQRSRTPPVIASTPTPPPKSGTPQHSRNDSAPPTKTSEQIRLEMVEKVRKSKEEEDAAKSAKVAAETKLKDEEKAKDDAKAVEEAKVKEEAEAKAAAEKAKQEEDDEMERQIQEIEAAEAEREKKEEELLAKRQAEKKAADAANAEKRKAEAAANDLKLKEQEREMERLEDEKERKRNEAEAKAASGNKAPEASKDAAKTESSTPSTLATKLSNLTLGTESGASTPDSDGSMGPPPKVNPAEKRGKPAALNLAPLNTKPIEPPQPSAALQSLKSARFLTILNSSLYPPNISSPNPALNSAVTTKGKSFKYDKEFLLQFQKVFVEKPSMEFESQIKALIGGTDGGSAHPGSARAGGGGSMGPRQNSSRSNQPGAFAMGSFGAVGGKTLPPGTTSEMRFAMASGAIPRPQPNSTASFTRAGGAGFPGGNQMARGMSNPGMNNIPHSPRQQSRTQRGGSRKDNFQGSNAKQEAQAAKTMPLTAGMDLKPIQVTASGWKPRSIGQSQSATGAAGPTPGSSGATGHMEPDMVQRKVKAALNKMTPEKFDKIADQILTIAAQSKDEADGRTLRQVIQLTFEKATDEAHWASMYAKFCKRMLETMSPEIKDESITDKNGNIVSGGNLFRKYLLNRCQEEFERGWKMDLPDKPEGEREDAKTEEAAMLSDEYYVAETAKRRGLGLVQFIGELYKLSMLTERIMHECVKKLVDYTGIPDEAEIESLTKLLKTIGFNLDSTEKGKPMMDVYFQRIQSMVDTPDLPSRLRFMLMDIIDLRKKRWASKDNNKGPKTLEEVRVEVEAAASQKAAESNARGSQRGGGRMQMGRGDSRNFSNQYNQPPVDYQKNTVGMDDLRRLTNKNASRASSQQMSFGPTSMFSSRSNSGRKMGPGGSLSRTGEDSGASSRTGTPPHKEKESATSANAFSLLAGLGSGDADPTSPPSASVSPALSKATPASADKSGDKESES